MPDCVPLSSCLMDSSSVTTFPDGPDECRRSVADWSGSVRAEGSCSCSSGATRPGPGTQGQRVGLHTLLGLGAARTHTSSSDKQGQLSGVGLPAGPYEHDHLVVRVFGDVSAVDQHDQVSFHERGLASTSL